MQVQIRISQGSGPHRAKIEFYRDGKWHFLKWATRREMLQTYPQTKEIQND